MAPNSDLNSNRNANSCTVHKSETVGGTRIRLFCQPRALFLTVAIKKWHVVYTKAGEKVVAGFVNLAKSQGARLGIQVEQPTMSALPNDVSGDVNRGTINPSICGYIFMFITLYLLYRGRTPIWSTFRRQ